MQLPEELDKFRPLSPESKRSTMDAEELGKLRTGADAEGFGARGHMVHGALNFDFKIFLRWLHSKSDGGVV